MVTKHIKRSFSHIIVLTVFKNYCYSPEVVVRNILTTQSSNRQRGNTVAVHRIPTQNDRTKLRTGRRAVRIFSFGAMCHVCLDDTTFNTGEHRSTGRKCRTMHTTEVRIRLRRRVHQLIPLFLASDRCLYRM